MSERSWTTPAEIDAEMRRRWLRGDLLRAELGEGAYPLVLPLRRPAASEVSERFGEVRDWIRSLERGSTAGRGYGYEILWEEVRHRIVGKNRIPQRVTVATNDDALRLAGRSAEAASFLRSATRTLARFPDLRAWIARKPLVLVEHADAWERLLDLLDWFRTHPQPYIYLRQIDVPNVDTKFVESRKALLAELLDLVLPEAAYDRTASGTRAFERRYGLLAKPTLLRFRVLDARLHVGRFSDISVPLDEFARTPLDVDRVFVTENEANGLAFPAYPRSLVIFGLGYGVQMLERAAWLASKQLIYWGDIDTHGFAILDRLRGHFPQTVSLLMDRRTLHAHREFWTHEARPHAPPLERLTPEERSLYDDLRDDRLGHGVRLEQERIPFSRLARAVEDLDERLGIDDVHASGGP